MEEVKLDAQKLLVSSKCNHINLQISCLLVDICKKNLLVNLLLLLLHQVEEVERIRSEKVIFFEEDDASIELLRRVENLKDLVCLPPPVVLCLGDLENNFDAHIYRLEIKLMLPQKFFVTLKTILMQKYSHSFESESEAIDDDAFNDDCDDGSL